MRFDFGLFDGDTLLERGSFVVSTLPLCAHFASFHAAHVLEGDVAKIVLSRFPPEFDLKTATLDVPVHESDDWESIELARYALAFRCYLCS
jgi:hypothetical protein